PTELGPAFLSDGNDATDEFEDEDCVVVTLGLLAMHLGRHVRVHRFDRRSTKHPAKEFDGVAAHVHRDPAAGPMDIPKMRCMRAVMFLGLLQKGGMAERAGVEKLLQT